MLVQVTQQHIDAARAFNARNRGLFECPLKLAIEDVLPGCEVSRPTVGAVWIDGVPHALPAACDDWMLAFDTASRVEPFEFSFACEVVPAAVVVAA